MEGDAKIETVFGDAAQYKKYIDRFFFVHPEMQKTHEDFSRNVLAVISSLGAAQNPSQCPLDAVALSYFRAYQQGQSYHKLGKELEAQYGSIKELDGLGETQGLTPDYRWKVAKALKLYAAVLRDFREMKVAFQSQLTGELTYHHCEVQALIAKGEELEKSGADPPPTPVVQQKPKKDKRPELAAPIPASMATFFVDNSSCPNATRVILDGSPLGEVASASKAAFRSYVGRHDLCLIPLSSQTQCGEPGTLRKTYIHDGWSITLRCD